ncbi:nuclear pore complex NUP96 [Olea europaea subsp. europaea]|uniref:Nuclear pore complex NUP96 n=1 Tax=Olea europaea subsp. europaea TaxID=158383 RepID=A0A8S0R9Z7_OLEEU|nr:nuclear pore complex NUP96 [Olea europaea subsp. europaea]
MALTGPAAYFMEVDVGIFDPVLVLQSQYKRRRISLDSEDDALSCRVLRDIEDSLPTLRSFDYYTEACLSELATWEFKSPGFCSRVQDFTAGRVGYGCVKFIGETDVRWLNLDQIIKFNRCEIIAYEDESSKPVVGQGLNKLAEVTILLQAKSFNHCNEDCLRKLKCKTESQGAQLISFDPINGKWKFLVQHFSRFGLSEDDDEDIIMNSASPDAQDLVEMIDGEVLDIDNGTAPVDPTLLSHSLPAHLGLDPVKMREMRMLMFPAEEEDIQNFNDMHSSLIEYNPRSYNSSSPGSMLMVQQNKGLHLKASKSEGFELDLEHETPVSGSHSHNIVDAALFMGRSFRAGWGPNGVLVHCGMPVGNTGY